MPKNDDHDLACRAERLALGHLADVINLESATGYRVPDLHRDAVELLRSLAPFSKTIAEAAEVVDVQHTRYANPGAVVRRIRRRRGAIKRLVSQARGAR